MSRKDDILDALGDIIESKGINANFTISELAKKVDIGKSTIYEYFSTKEELLSEAMVRVFEQAMNAIQSRTLDSALSFEESLKQELHFAFELATSSSYIFKMLTPGFRDTIPSSMKGQFAQSMRETTKQYEVLFQNVIAKGLEEGVLNPENLVLKGAIFGALIGGSVQQVTRAANGFAVKVDHDEFINGIYDTVIKIFN